MLALSSSLALSLTLATALPLPLTARAAIPPRSIAGASRCAGTGLTAGTFGRLRLTPGIGQLQLTLRIESGLDERRLLAVAESKLGATAVDPADLLQRAQRHPMDRVHPRTEQQGVRLRFIERVGELDSQVQRCRGQGNHRTRDALADRCSLLGSDRRHGACRCRVGRRIVRRDGPCRVGGLIVPGRSD